ncbi:Bug family tripartite tricarboxylate transporter substrate binding protein [Roseomonas xinghualingensis]|uniref:Bug family tripartite tricarboxylate transporter substrate binding protein n=1 Tax=Roseomonas xinghualingensis TaxID=2986475 RepID=UPI0021F0F31F|nr:tripartite tricarboxylate transporter substrate-binding protein [Roseomonas sp. SXEYE001]MCV4207182.1 tripartite tricarboxylate transporter substrate-binding protein [Roseomonas sp. SXEYE001]
MTKTTRRGLLAASGAMLAMPALAQRPWPDRPVTLLVPYAAGGSNDVVARLLAPRLQAVLGQSFVVENRTGAGGAIGTAAVARGPADGTLFLVSSASNHVMNPIVSPGHTPDPREVFAGVSMLVDVPLALTVANKLGVTDLPGLLALLRREPGRHSFASSGVGGSQHLAGELFAMKAGVDIVHVPYRGGGPALNDLVAGQVSLAFLNLPTALPQAEAGTVKILAVAGERRSALKPDIATVAEAGVPGFAVRSWTALFAPRATPPDIISRFSAVVRDLLTDPAVKARLAELGTEAEPSEPAALDSFVRGEFGLWEPVIRAAKVTAQ